MSRRKGPRGYAVAVLIGLEKHKASIWNVYSKSIRSNRVIEYDKDDYNYFETIINQIRQKIKQGIKTIIIASEERKNYDRFFKHVNKHQKWLLGGYELNKITLEYIEGSAENIYAVNQLIDKSELKKIVNKANYQENKSVMKEFEKRLGSSNGIDTLLFALEKVENVIYENNHKLRPEYIILTTEFHRKNRRRTQRLLQISKNKGIKTMIIEKKSALGTRLSQFGGLLCMTNRSNRE